MRARSRRPLDSASDTKSNDQSAFGADASADRSRLTALTWRRHGQSARPFQRRLTADKGYHADALRRDLRAAGTMPIIPGRRKRKRAIGHDRSRYKDRWRIEAAFCRLKDFRRVATRYDKLAANFASAVALAGRRYRVLVSAGFMLALANTRGEPLGMRGLERPWPRDPHSRGGMAMAAWDHATEPSTRNSRRPRCRPGDRPGILHPLHSTYRPRARPHA